MPLPDSVRTWWIILAALLTTTLGCAKTAPPDATASTAEDTSPVDSALQLLDLDNHPVDFWKQSAGQITVVVFTRTDCPISNRAAPEVRRLCEKYGPSGVQFDLIYVDPHEQPDAIREHLRQYEYPCAGLRDPKHALVAYCKATVTPEAVVFGKDGDIKYQGRINNQYVELGNSRADATSNDLADAIESTLLGQSVATPRTRAIGCSIADLKD
jgi:hypothetical protein